MQILKSRVVLTSLSKKETLKSKNISWKVSSVRQLFSPSLSLSLFLCVSLRQVVVFAPPTIRKNRPDTPIHEDKPVENERPL